MTPAHSLGKAGGGHNGDTLPLVNKEISSNFDNLLRVRVSPLWPKIASLSDYQQITIPFLATKARRPGGHTT